MTDFQTTTGADAGVPLEPHVSCLWGQDDDGTWETSCGHAFEFNDGDPCDNGFLFCPYCGHRLKVLVYADADSDDS